MTSQTNVHVAQMFHTVYRMRAKYVFCMLHATLTFIDVIYKMDLCCLVGAVNFHNIIYGHYVLSR